MSTYEQERNNRAIPQDDEMMKLFSERKLIELHMTQKKDLLDHHEVRKEKSLTQ